MRLLQAPWAPVTRRWSEEAARAIAFSINTSACLLDLDAVIVDGAVGAPVLAHLIDAVRAALAHYSWQGITRPDLIAALPPCLSIGMAQYIPVFPICRK